MNLHTLGNLFLIIVLVIDSSVSFTRRHDFLRHRRPHTVKRYEITRRNQRIQASERQGGIVSLLGSPFAAATLTAAGAAAIGIYATNQEDIHSLYNSFFAPCQNVICANNTNRCVGGKCQCGETSGLICNLNSEFPLCSNGTCRCSAGANSFNPGNGNTQGSCLNEQEKCQTNGLCLECISSSQCIGLTDSCLGNRCFCGPTIKTCNSTIANHCIDGLCKCGTNDQCSTRLQQINGIQRSDQEKCEKVSDYYNPEHIKDRIYNREGKLVSRDDGKGQHTGTYQCLDIIHRCRNQGGRDLTWCSKIDLPSGEVDLICASKKPSVRYCSIPSVNNASIYEHFTAESARIICQEIGGTLPDLKTELDHYRLRRVMNYLSDFISLGWPYSLRWMSWPFIWVNGARFNRFDQSSPPVFKWNSGRGDVVGQYFSLWQNNEPDSKKFDYDTRLHTPLTREAFKNCGAAPQFSCSISQNFACNQKCPVSLAVDATGDELEEGIKCQLQSCQPDRNNIFVDFDVVKATTEDSVPVCMAVYAPNLDNIKSDGTVTNYDSCNVMFNHQNKSVEATGFSKWVDINCNQRTRSLICANIGPQTQECPASHPYAYNYGTHCCQFGSEGAGCNKFPDQEACDGSLLTQASRSCKYNARFRCPDLCINKEPSTCRGMLSDESTCCSISNPCEIYEGVCSADEECAGSLICGNNNCQRYNPGGNWDSEADCCVPPCNGTPATNWDCCTESDPCDVGKGDCDTNNDCLGDLVCRIFGCEDDFSSDGSNWGNFADCCAYPCTGTPGTNINCCNSFNPCNYGEGNCKQDSECSGSLVCGSRNCLPEHSKEGSNWSEDANCCTTSTDGGVSCSISGETLVDGLCKCGSSASCTYQSTGSYCDSANSECKCSENKPACPGSAICSNGQCLGTCNTLEIVSSGPAREHAPLALGTYQYKFKANGRNVYLSSDGEYFLRWSTTDLWGVTTVPYDITHWYYNTGCTELTPERCTPGTWKAENGFEVPLVFDDDTLTIECAECNEDTCTNPGETCVGGVCKCGSSPSCVGAITGAYCDAENSLCKCAEALDACYYRETCDAANNACKCGSEASCADKSTGSYCDAANNVCKCTASVSACISPAICDSDNGLCKCGTANCSGGEICDVSNNSCNCGTASSCAGQSTGSFCDAANNVCKCTRSLAACTSPETCDSSNGVCRCGTALSCVGRSAGSYCDAETNMCKCTASLSSCAGQVTGSYCDADNNVCKCSASVPACEGQSLCTVGVCIEKEEYRWCRNSYGGYTTLTSAIEACKSDNGCVRVYDRFCDNTGPFKLCGSLADVRTSSSSCLYSIVKTCNMPSDCPSGFDCLNGFCVVCRVIEISSSGGAAQALGNRMGIYTIQDNLNDGRVVYKHETRNDFLYYVNAFNGVWFVGSVVGSTSVALYNNGCDAANVPVVQHGCTSGWFYSDSGFKSDSTLTANCKVGGTKRISNIGTIENFDKIKNVQYGEHKKQLEPEHEAEEDFSRHWREPPEADEE